MTASRVLCVLALTANVANGIDDTSAMVQSGVHMSPQEGEDWIPGDRLKKRLEEALAPPQGLDDYVTHLHRTELETDGQPFHNGKVVDARSKIAKVASKVVGKVMNIAGNKATLKEKVGEIVNKEMGLNAEEKPIQEQFFGYEGHAARNLDRMDPMGTAVRQSAQARKAALEGAAADAQQAEHAASANAFQWAAAAGVAKLTNAIMPSYEGAYQAAVSSGMHEQAKAVAQAARANLDAVENQVFVDAAADANLKTHIDMAMDQGRSFGKWTAFGANYESRCAEFAAEHPVRPAPEVNSVHHICKDFRLKYWFNGAAAYVHSTNSFYFTNFNPQPHGSQVQMKDHADRIEEHGTSWTGGESCGQRVHNAGDIIRYSVAEDRCEMFAENVACNGLRATQDGTGLYAGCWGNYDAGYGLMHFDAVTRMPSLVANSYMGMRLPELDDIDLHVNGDIYFLAHGIPSNTCGMAPRATAPKGVYKVDRTGAVSLLKMGSGNGLAFSPGSTELTVIGMGTFSIVGGMLVQTSHASDVVGKSLEAGSDHVTPYGGSGVAIDCLGNRYASNVYNDQGNVNGLYQCGSPGNIYDAKYNVIGQFPSGTNAAFGGLGGHLMMVVCSHDQREGGAFIVDMSLPGMP